ncbi:peptidase C1B bleomycin hydrolase [Mycena floridula]|nr:peptidase C1B bleomycin hydrolase [Mycena floridula]
MGSAASKPASVAAVDIDHDEKGSLSGRMSMMNLRNTVTPLSANGSLTLSNLSDWETDIASDPKTQLSRTILSHSNINEALISRPAVISTAHIFNTELAFKTGPITNQKSSGRCWLFATTNVLRYDIMKTLKLDSFELSQSYLFFFDKLNKANYYLELSIQNADLPIDDRLVSHLNSDICSDGGQFDMAVNLLENYGVVPQSIYPESTHSSLSGPLNSLIKTKLREHALILRALSASLKAQSFSEDIIINTLRSEKEKLMKEIYTIMTATLGVPPSPDKKFTWDHYKQDGTFGTWEGTPKDYFKAFSNKTYPPLESFSLINDPRNEYSKLYTVSKLGNVWGGRPVLYVNTEIETLKNMVVKMLKAGLPVFFGCDVGKFSDREHGIMDTSLFAYETAFNISLGLTKAERLQANESSMTHAMVISGVHLDANGKPVRYKVENSWGTASVGEKGFFVMSDAWFEQFTYQIVVPRKLAPKNLVDVLDNSEAVVLPPWDPMGALA